ncbi:type II secretion system protein [Roseisolibacter sp. H3M3-2]|nr:type II secretion system protein [Roseisolibacter sp. H3M3-2]
MARAGFSMVEVLIVIGMVGVLVMIAGPRARAFREGASIRGARMELATAIEAARAAAIQRGRPARVRIRTDSIVVTVDTGAPGAAASGRYRVLGPLRLDSEYVVTVTAADVADSIITFDSRGLANPRLGADGARYVIQRGVRKDSVCVSNLGMILPRECAP